MGTYGDSTMMCSMDEATLMVLLAEMDAPDQPAKVLRLANAAADADIYLADADAMVVAPALQH